MYAQKFPNRYVSAVTCLKTVGMQFRKKRHNNQEFLISEDAAINLWRYLDLPCRFAKSNFNATK